MEGETSLHSLPVSDQGVDAWVGVTSPLRREVALAHSNHIAAVEAEEVDRAEGAVGDEVSWFIDECVLAAELVLDVLEADGHFFQALGVEGAAAGGVGDLLQDVVAAVAAGAGVRADGVDDGLGALALLDGVVEIGVALVIVAVGDQDHGLADGLLPARGIEQLVTACAVNSVEERGSTAGAQRVDAGGEQVKIVAPVLLIVGHNIEAHDEAFVGPGLDDLKKKLDSRLLLELEARPDGGAGVDHDADAQGQIRLPGKAVDAFRGLLVIEEREVALLEVRDEVPVAVGNRKDEIDFVDLPGDGVFLVAWLLAGGCLLAGGW